MYLYRVSRPTSRLLPLEKIENSKIGESRSGNVGAPTLGEYVTKSVYCPHTWCCQKKGVAGASVRMYLSAKENSRGRAWEPCWLTIPPSAPPFFGLETKGLASFLALFDVSVGIGKAKPGVGYPGPSRGRDLLDSEVVTGAWSRPTWRLAVWVSLHRRSSTDSADRIACRGPFVYRRATNNPWLRCSERPASAAAAPS